MFPALRGVGLNACRVLGASLPATERAMKLQPSQPHQQQQSVSGSAAMPMSSPSAASVAAWQKLGDVEWESFRAHGENEGRQRQQKQQWDRHRRAWSADESRLVKSGAVLLAATAAATLTDTDNDSVHALSHERAPDLLFSTAAEGLIVHEHRSAAGSDAGQHQQSVHSSDLEEQSASTDPAADGAALVPLPARESADPADAAPEPSLARRVLAEAVDHVAVMLSMQALRSVLPSDALPLPVDIGPFAVLPAVLLRDALGLSLGNRLMGIEVVRDSADAPRSLAGAWAASAMRNLPQALFLFSMALHNPDHDSDRRRGRMLLVGEVAMVAADALAGWALDAQRRRLCDVLAGTRVRLAQDSAPVSDTATADAVRARRRSSNNNNNNHKSDTRAGTSHTALRTPLVSAERAQAWREAVRRWAAQSRLQLAPGAGAFGRVEASVQAEAAWFGGVHT